ncbi:MAG TPA: AAA family ATPase, partial [Clostridia bacterium]|nr:AAA family ATPase [Clostridia bacterium]
LINRDIENYTISINKKSHELDENLKTAEKFEQEIIHQNEHIEALDIKAKDNEETLDLKQLNKENLLKEINGIEARKKELGKVIEEIRERKHSMEVQLSRAEIELENSQNRVWEEYELSYAHALDYKDDTLNITGIRREIQNIRKKIDGLGNINVNAVEEYKRIKERYDFLTLQKDDLTTAKDNLQGIIEDITATMEEKFVEEFAIINRHFNKVFSQLFGGGKAELVLEDLNDVLTSGIEIVAQPPGKKLQSISLLSGGEKALTAISILFAILETKPTPFCVLDEIEAALDESNVRSFGQFIRKFSENTQFVLITHRKGTMENSDVLYGVAMEEKGVSRMISVRLEDQAS